MFCFDVETLSTNSDAVILSMACIYFDASTKPSPDSLRENAFFAKFDVADQVNRLNRVVSKSTLEWWAKQPDAIKARSFNRSDTDILIDDGIESMRKWTKQFPLNKKCWVWARGNLDQIVLNSMEDKLQVLPVFPFHRWRDIRTGIDLMVGSTNGYCDVDYPGFDRDRDIQKHDPVDDCILDAMMLMYGCEKTTSES
jgi:hypothetical protein